jgi:hypothetical protein
MPTLPDGFHLRPDLPVLVALELQKHLDAFGVSEEVDK